MPDPVVPPTPPTPPAPPAPPAPPEPWQAALPEDFRADPSLTPFTNDDLVPMPKALAKSYIETKRLVGRDKIPMPQTPEEYASAFERLGKPKTTQEYGLNTPTDIPENVKPIIGQEELWFREAAHKAHLTNTQAAALWTEVTGKVLSSSKELSDQYQKELRDTEQQLRIEHGTSYDAKLALANRALQDLGGPDLVQLVAQTGVGRHPAGVKMMIKLGEIMAEEQGIDPNTGSPKGSAITIEQGLMGTMADPAYLNGSDPRHKIVVQKALRLRSQLDDYNRRRRD